MKCNNTFEIASGETTSPCELEINHNGDCKSFILGSPCSWDSRFSSEEEQYLHNKKIDNFAVDLLTERLEHFQTQIIMADTVESIKEDMTEYLDYKSKIVVLKNAINKLNKI